MNEFKFKTPSGETYNNITPGTVVASKAVITDANNKIDTLDITTPKIGGVAITSTATELNTLDGLTRGNIIVGGVANATSKLNAKTSGQILVGDGTDLISVPVSGDATLANDGTLTLAVPKLSVISKVCAIADFTDDGGTSGHIDFSNNSLPAGSLVLGWKAVVTGEFKGDASAVIQIGVVGTLGKFSASVAQSVFTTGTVGSGAPMDTSFNATAATPRITVTSGSDFAAVVTDGTGAMTVYLYYIATV